MKKITNFVLQDATYRVQIETGEVVVLHLNYAGKTYKLEGQEKLGIKRLAEDLIERKSTVNYAAKYSQYEIE